MLVWWLCITEKYQQSLAKPLNKGSKAPELSMFIRHKGFQNNKEGKYALVNMETSMANYSFRAPTCSCSFSLLFSKSVI